MGEIAIGRKEIMAALHVADWGTIRNWKRSYAMPIRYMPNGRPMLLLSELKVWLVKFSEIKKNTHPFSTQTHPFSTPTSRK
jgi:hypothetical protein